MTSPIDPSLTANSPSVYTDLNGLSALKRDAKAQSPESVRKVAQQFESIFAKMVLSSMRQANFGDDKHTLRASSSESGSCSLTRCLQCFSCLCLRSLNRGPESEDEGSNKRHH